MYKEFKDFIHTLAETSAAIIVPYFGNPDLKVESKKDNSPVTEADRKAEQVMRDLIRKKYPSHGIIEEEFGNENESAEFVWVLDPIDGTISFSHNSPHFGTLIGLLHEGKPVLGAINQPVLNQLCIGDTKETTLNNRPVRCRNVRDLSEATLLTTDIAGIAQYKTLAGFEKLREKTKLFRTWGDCYGYLLLATGWADIMIDPMVNPWDILPLIPVIQGAHGTITTWEGGDAAKGRSCVAANSHLHPAVIEMLQSS